MQVNYAVPICGAPSKAGVPLPSPLSRRAPESTESARSEQRFMRQASRQKERDFVPLGYLGVDAAVMHGGGSSERRIEGCVRMCAAAGALPRSANTTLRSLNGSHDGTSFFASCAKTRSNSSFAYCLTFPSEKISALTTRDFPFSGHLQVLRCRLRCSYVFCYKSNATYPVTSISNSDVREPLSAVQTATEKARSGVCR